MSKEEKIPTTTGKCERAKRVRSQLQRRTFALQKSYSPNQNPECRKCEAFLSMLKNLRFLTLRKLNFGLSHLTMLFEFFFFFLKHKYESKEEGREKEEG